MKLGRIILGTEVPPSTTLTPDFCIVGSGAGGSVAAAVLAESGASVVILEEGGHHVTSEFLSDEAEAYPTLYQEHGNRATEDLAIQILQGRNVGGGTTINWATSFRTPESTLKVWAERYGLIGISEALSPHFDMVEDRLNVTLADDDFVNANNRKLWNGAVKLGWEPEMLRRSVKDCIKLGSCGMGCPAGAKMTAQETYLRDAVAAGADIYANCRAIGFETDGRRATAVIAEILNEELDRPRGARVTVRPRRGILLACGAINTPALLLRSNVGTAGGLVGKRTFLHPTVPMIGIFDDRIAGFRGAPQTVSVRRFTERGNRVGYFLETAPVHPMLASISFPGFGDAHRRIMERMAHAQATIALLMDGHGYDSGGEVSCGKNGRVTLKYPISRSICEAAVDAQKSMARLLLAAGAREVMTLHTDPLSLRNEAEIARIDTAPFGPNLHTMFSAHQMGGCPMGSDPERSVVDGRGLHRQFDNLWIADGSVFPTSAGVNPQISIYAISRLFATEITKSG